MATPNTLRYIKVDYQAHKDAILQRVRARYPRLWNDFLTNSFGILLVDVIAWSTATAAFLINRAAGENFVSTMTLRESAVNIGSLVGYQLSGPTAASVMCEASITQAQASATVTISAGTVIRSTGNAALPFEVYQDYFIEPGQTTPVTAIVSISPLLSGAKVLSTYAQVTPGSSNVDLLDTSIDLSQYVEAGQVFQVTGESATYVIQEIQAAPGALSNNRLVLASAYAGAATASVTAEIYDRRILCIQGLTVNESFTSPSDNSPSFVVMLGSTPVIQDSVSVSVNGQTWSQVDNFAKSADDATDYTFTVTPSGQPLVTFGDGVFGSLIPTDATIIVTYRVGGGTNGNIELNSINTSITGLLSSTSGPITIQVTNTTGTGSGGKDAESLEEARIKIPAATRANNRAVTLDDYQTIAMSYPGISFARAVVRTENSLLEGNVVFVYAWINGPTGTLVNLSPLQKLNLQAYMQTKAVGTDFVTIGDGSAVPLPVSLRFKVLDGFDVTSTALAIQSALTDFVNLVKPGQPVIYSYLFSTLDAISGVDTLIMATPTGDLYPSNTLELFIPPDSNYSYALTKSGVGTPEYSSVDGVNVSQYSAQLPVFPLQAWSFKLYLGLSQLTVAPGIFPGTAQVFGPNLSTDIDNYPSTVNLLTGQITLWIIGAPGDLSMKLIPIVGYSSEKIVNIYVGYSGDTSQSKRREIRSAVDAWGNGLAVGAAMYGQQVSGIIGSASNITKVISSVSGVTAVSRVALDFPGNAVNVINTVETELIRVGNVILNNEID